MHPTDGELRRELDGEAAPGEAERIRTHVDGCVRCRDRQETLRRTATLVGRALEEVRGTAGRDPDFDSARESIRRRLTGSVAGPDHRSGPEPARGSDPGADRGRSVSPRRDPRRSARSTMSRGALVRAAVVILLFAGGLAASVPGSPVREWLSGIGTPETPPATVLDRSAGESSTRPAGAGVRVAPDDGALSIRLTDAEPGTRVRMSLVTGATGGVFASGGTFRSGAGFVEVTDATGEVTVEIPRSVQEAEVAAGDRVLFRKSDDALTLPFEGADTTGTELLFTLPAGGEGP